MEFIERLPLRPIHFLARIKFDDFKQDCINDAIINKLEKPKEIDIKTWYNNLQQFCKCNIKTKGITKRVYSYSAKSPAGLGGRLFCGGSVQGIWGKYRGLLMRDISTDLDMANAHPVALRYICHLHDIHCPHLEYYINHRDECLKQFPSREVGKRAYLCATNMDKLSRKSENPEQFKCYDKEMKQIQKKLIGLSEYQALFDTVPVEKRESNYNGCAINRILCYYENIILQHAIHFLNTKQIEVAVPMFDGAIIYGNYYDDMDLLSEITNYVNQQMPNLNMTWSYKEHDTSLSIPDDFDESEKEVDELEDIMFDAVAKKFELQHAKILNAGIFIKQTEDEVVYMSKSMFVCAYEHMKCIKMVSDNDGGYRPKSVNFINNWIKDNPSQRQYETVGCFPNPSKCPTNVFNTWIPFVMEKVSEWKHHQEGLDMIRNHIKILCNNSVEVAEYFEKWIAQMIQYPEVKSICPVLISKEGAGKGTLMQLFSKMFGSKKIFETADPSRDVWGNFNGRMAAGFLVNLNELSKKDTMDAEGRMKALITDPTLSINSKGVNQFEIQSYHRFIITTNKEEPVSTTKDDRRKLIIRTSDELCGNKEYFGKMYELLDNVDVIKTCYEYFKSIPDMASFGRLPIPTTAYQTEMAELSASPIELWMKYYVERLDVSKPVEDGQDDPLSMSTEKFYKRFMDWCEKYGSEFDKKISCVQFGVRLQRLNLTGLSTKHTKKGNHKVIDLEVMKKHFGIGCLITTR